jgi:hypothetical protein
MQDINGSSTRPPQALTLQCAGKQQVEEVPHPAGNQSALDTVTRLLWWQP